MSMLYKSIMTSPVNKKISTPLYKCFSADWCHDQSNLPVLGAERLGQCESQAIPLEPRRGVSSHCRGGWDPAPFVHGDQYDQRAELLERFPMVIGQQTTPFIQGSWDFLYTVLIQFPYSSDTVPIQFSYSSYCQPAMFKMCNAAA